MNTNMAQKCLKGEVKYELPRTADYISKAKDKELLSQESIVIFRINCRLDYFRLNKLMNNLRLYVFGTSRTLPFSLSMQFRSRWITQQGYFVSLQIKCDQQIPSIQFHYSRRQYVYNLNILQKWLCLMNDEMNQESHKKIEDRSRTETARTISNEDILINANKISGDFVLTKKSVFNENIKYKARFVVGGHWYKMKSSTFHLVQNFRTRSVLMLLVVAIIYKRDIRTADISQVR